MALVVLGAAGAVPRERIRRLVVLGELGLDGRVRAVRGVLPAVLAAAADVRTVVVPIANAAEAGLVPGITAYGVKSLRELLTLLPCSTEALPPSVRAPAAQPAPAGADRPDLCEVIGQPIGRRALELAAAGGHHLYLAGAPGAGKTMLAERLPGLLPELDPEAALEVTAVHSIAGTRPCGCLPS